MTYEGLHLKAQWLGSQRIELESCGSTNDEACRLARAGANRGTVVIAERQTAGRGREGRPWASPPGGLYMSVVLRPPLPLHAVPPMTLAIGIGVCSAVRAFGAPASLKWPNDLLVDGRKLAGVLVEAQSQGNRLESVVAGIGINLDGELPGELGERGITLAEAAGLKVARPGGPGRAAPPQAVRSTARPGAPGRAAPPQAVRSTIDREAFIESLLAHVEIWVERYVAVGLEAIVPAWMARMAHGLVARATPMHEGGPLEGIVEGLDAEGSLLLRDSHGTLHHVRSGDVEVVRPSPRAESVDTSGEASASL